MSRINTALTLTLTLLLLLAAAPAGCGDGNLNCEDCPPEVGDNNGVDNPTMNFECGTGGITLTVQFTLDKDGRIEGFTAPHEYTGTSTYTPPKPEEIESVGYWVDGLSSDKWPTASYDSKVTIRLPFSQKPNPMKGNLLLRLKDKKEPSGTGLSIWANLGDSGGWVIKGATVKSESWAMWIEVDCPGPKTAPPPVLDGGLPYPDAKAKPDLPPVVEKSPVMTFVCCKTEAVLTVTFATDKLGGLKGFVGTTPLPSEVKEVAFFLDGVALSKAPVAKYAAKVTIDLPALAKGNLFLRLKNGKEAWANLGNSGGWMIKGAKVVAQNGKSWLEVSTCSGK